MCYAFMCSGSENYNRNRRCRKRRHKLSPECRCASWQTFWQLYYFTTFYFLSCWLVAMAVLKVIVSLYRVGEEKPIERCKTSILMTQHHLPWLTQSNVRFPLGSRGLFFETVKYLGGQRTRNFLRGPGFHGTGRGGKGQFTTFADFNLCGPSQHVSNRCKAGYTTDWNN